MGRRSCCRAVGYWKVTLVNKQLHKDQFVEAWIQRDDTPYGFPRRGRQSYFDQPCYRRFNAQGREIEEDAGQPHCNVQRAGSINAIATGSNTIVVGGYLHKEMRPASYSAGGPISPAAQSDRTGPDVLAVSDDSIVRRGVLGAGTRSGSVVVLNGTSVAAPQITRVIAAELAAAHPSDDQGAWGSGEPGSPPTGRQAIAEHTRPLYPPHAPRGQPRPGRERIGMGRIEPPAKGTVARRRRAAGRD